ncbi:tetratricopeptide repeat protein [Gracilimonas sp. Q87]|uniref:tetratricopeptide repeat protein n=1 Tax=Gracilimonas sp. Q87 TaxID=3384766 RepID=UPI003983E215
MKNGQQLKKNLKYVSWAEIVVHFTDMKYVNIKKLTRLSAVFNRVHVLAPESGPLLNTTDISWHIYNKDITRTTLWNSYLKKVESEWVLFIENDEQVIFMDFPEEKDISFTRWAPVLITVKAEEKRKQFYQMRFVHNSGKAVFQGQDFPDCTAFITGNSIEISNMPIQIERESDFINQVDPLKELSVSDYAPSVYLIEGERCVKKGKYTQAASQYRQLLKKEHLLPFDRLAGVNGLASCYTEQYKWEKALLVTKQSMETESLQNIPYLIEFRIYQLQRKWEKAFFALNRYHELSQLYSKASFDVALSEEETLVNLADLSMKLGKRDKSKEYLKEIFKIKNGNVETSFLRKLLLLCLELKDKERAIYFFNKVFEGSYPNKLNEEQKIEFNDYMNLFMKNEWYEFVHNIYNRLLQSYPNEDEYKRRLIVVSIKTNRIEKARKLAAKVA